MPYLNHAGTSWPKPAPVREAVQRALAADPADWATSFAAHHAAVAAAFGIGEPDRLLLTPGCTSALATAVGALPWRGGERIATSAWEHQALAGPAQRLAARGVEHVVVGPGGGGPLDLDRLEGELRGGRVRLVAMCAACNVTGELLPVGDVVELAHRYGALVLVDAAQTAGWSDDDVTGLGADLFAFAGHKGPQAPWGIGGLYAAPGVPFEGAAPGYCDTGSVDRLALAGLAAGLAWLQAPARAERLARARSIIEALCTRLEATPGVSLHGPRAPAARVPTIAFTVAGCSAGAVAEALAAQDVIASGGRQCAPLAHETLGTLDGGVVRLSAGPETALADAVRAADAVESVCREASRSGRDGDG